MNPKINCLFFIVLLLNQTLGYYTATLSQPRTSLAATSSENGLVFFGGGTSSSGTYTRTVDTFNSTSGERRTANLSVPRGLLTATHAGEKIIFAGGRLIGAVVTSIVDIYSTATDTWSTSLLSAARSNFASVTIGSTAIFSGGYPPITWTYPYNIDFYTASTGNWTSTQRIYERYDLAGAATDSLALFGGGVSWPGVLDIVDIYNLTSNTWNTSQLSQARELLAAASVGSLLFFGGGIANGVYSDCVDIYNSASNTWNRTNLSIPRSELAAAAVGDLVLFAGGISYDGPVDTIDVFNVTSGASYTLSLSQPRRRLAAATVGNAIYFGGGSTSSGVTDRVDIFKYCQNDCSRSYSHNLLRLSACDDGIYCNGQEKCQNGFCRPSSEIPCAAGLPCNNSCNETTRECYAPAGSPCNNQLFCDGQDFCNGFGNCSVHSGNPCTGGAICSNHCNEDVDNCFAPAGTLCDNSYWCDGNDTCNGNGTCIHTGDPCEGGNQCSNVCNETAKTCFLPVGSSCNDGLWCNSDDFCDGLGNCSVHLGDACTNGLLCQNSCNEVADNCFSLLGTDCSSDSCSSDTCDGFGRCVHQSNTCDSNTLLVPIIVSSVLGTFVLILLLGLAYFCFVKRRRSDDSHRSIAMNPIVNYIQNIEVLERIGGGQFGDVYRARMDKTTNVALKKLRSSEYSEAFDREVALLTTLNHPAVVRLYGVHNSHQGEHYMVFEYMSEGNLGLLLQQKQNEIRVFDLWNMSHSIATGMRYLEMNNIVHRDLALRNILVDKDTNGKYVLKISDFGMSRLVEKGYYKINSDTIMPVKWSAPEVIEYENASSKSDVWSFGVCLWELFSFGKTPYPGMINKEVVDNVLAGYRMPCPTNCPNEIYEIMLTCWRVHPSERPSFADLVDTIQKFIPQQHKSDTSVAVLHTSTTETIYH